MTEEWVNIVGFEGHYRISNLGRIISSGRMRGHGKGFYKPEQILSPYINIQGYEQITIALPNATGMKKRNKQFRIHNLVANHFIRPTIYGEHVCHKDGNKLNNVLDNLYIGDCETNTMDRYRHGQTKVSVQDVKDIRINKDGLTKKELAAKYNLSVLSVSNYISGKMGVYIK